MEKNNVFYIEGNFEIVKKGDVFLTIKRVTLLKLIKKLGSINAASKELKMSYQQAWHFIKEMNEISPLPLVVRKRGGANGGGADVTKYGEKLITEFERIQNEQQAFLKEQTQKMLSCFF